MSSSLHEGIVRLVLSRLRPLPWETAPAAGGDEMGPLDLARLRNSMESGRAVKAWESIQLHREAEEAPGKDMDHGLSLGLGHGA